MSVCVRVTENKKICLCASGGIRTHASEENRTWVCRLRPLGHECNSYMIWYDMCVCVCVHAKKPTARFELATPCLRNRCTNHCAMLAYIMILLFAKRFGAAVARWAHNPKVRGSKPRIAIKYFFHSFIHYVYYVHRHSVIPRWKHQIPSELCS